MKKIFTKQFNIPKKSPIDFLNIPVDSDLEAFICPFLIENTKLEKSISRQVYNRVHEFLIKLNRDYISPNNRTDGLLFLSHLHEPNEYHLGYSSKNKGKAVSKTRAELIYNALRNNSLSRQNTGIANEAHFVLLLVKGIGQDIMSDIIANVCRDIFANFTNKLCAKFGIETLSKNIEFYNSDLSQWQTKTIELPTFLGKHIILLPKNIVSGGRAYSNLYNWFISSNYISAEILNRKVELPEDAQFISQMKDGTRKAIIKKIYQTYKKPKNQLIDFVIKYQGSLDEFVRYAKEHYPELVLEDLEE